MKNLGIEKWIELWLDSAGERVYQPALVSALSHSGYTILHNTSHNSLELGKDVICRDPNGELIALQLKGNPGSRFTIGQWQQLYNQILQLMHSTVPDAVTGKKAERHRPILVTNGEVEEDVVSAVTGFNQTEVPRLEGAKPLEVWKRGDLLKFFNNAANSVWPTDLGTQLLLQKATTADPTNSIDEEAIQAISLGALNWDEKPSTPQSFSRVSGLFTLLAIYVSPYIVQGNYYEATKVKAIGFCLAAGFFSKHQHTTKKASQSAEYNEARPYQPPRVLRRRNRRAVRKRSISRKRYIH